jgi:esterase/lipase superfamily enzyme
MSYPYPFNFKFMAGYLKKEKREKSIFSIGDWNKRYFTFDGSEFSYYRSKWKFFNEHADPDRITPLDQIKGFIITGDTTFQLLTQRRDFHLRASDQKERNKWLDVIQHTLTNRHEDPDWKKICKPPLVYPRILWLGNLYDRKPSSGSESLKSL